MRRLLPVMALASLGPGCLYVPTPNAVDYGSRARIEREQVLIQDGVTTREEVLLAFGEPEFSLGRGRVLGYTWVRCDGGFIMLMPCGMGLLAGSVGGRTTLRIEFDARGVAARHEFGP